MIAPTRENSRQLEDALDYLPRKGVLEYRRNQVVYDGEQSPAGGLSLIVQGRVKVAAMLEDGSQAVMGVFRANEFFGAVALIGEQAAPRERATAMENTTLMTWSRQEIESHIEKQPLLGMALIQVLVGRCVEFKERLQSLALDKTPQRVGLSLIHFAKSGTRESDGAVLIPPMSHELLSGYTATSREMVTFQMNHLRRQGFVRYSRKAIELYPEALAEHLRTQRV